MKQFKPFRNDKNSPIDVNLIMMIPDTVRYNVESKETCTFI